ncbi:unnamed protein product [Urochloa humidicola]
MQRQEDTVEDVVVVGAGLAGLATALGLHRKGVRSLVLESSPARRTAGFALTAWTNAFRALDALGVGDKIREQHLHLQALRVMSSATGKVAQELDLTVQANRRRLSMRGLPGPLHVQVWPRLDPPRVAVLRRMEKGWATTVLGGGAPGGRWRGGVRERVSGDRIQGRSGPNEIRCVRRTSLLQALEEELPRGTIRYSSKIVSIQEDGNTKILHLNDGSVLRAKVLIGCDGINSVVAKSRDNPTSITSEIQKHPQILKMHGRVTCNCSGAKLKQFVLANLTALKVPPKALAVIDRSEASGVFAVPLRFRSPLALVTASISKGGVCVAGDALHPMTPDLGQGGCAALEDSVVLARCLGEAILGEGAQGGGTESRRIEAGLQEYARIRRWRSVELVATAYVVGFIQQSNNAIVGFLRDKFLSGFMARRLLKMSEYDCGTLWRC